MPATEEISEPVIRENIVRAVADVFKTMLGRSVKLDPNTPTEEKKIEALMVGDGGLQVVGTVGFIGDVNGLVYFCLDQEFASQCTAQILGMTSFELQSAGDEVINDAIGELTNMVVGGFKNALCDAGYPCKLTIPSILRGRNFRIESTSTAQLRSYSFLCDDHHVAANIVIKTAD